MTTPQTSIPHSEIASPLTPSNDSGGLSLSKSHRIRNYLTEFPEATNQQVLNALEGFLVKYGDVANVRQNMKRKGAGASSGKRGRPPKSKSPAVTRDSAPPAGPTKTKGSSADIVDFALIDSGLQFINRCGDIDRAIQVLEAIRRIREM